MYDANLSYEENYTHGPFPLLTINKNFPKIKYTQQAKFEFLGVPLHIPFGVASGPLLNAKFMKVALDAGFCLPVYKTVRSSFWKCNDWPNVLSIQSDKSSLFADKQNRVEASNFNLEDYLKKNNSITNSFGAPSQSPEVWSQDFHSLLPYSQRPGLHAALSFQGSRLSTWEPAKAEEFYLNDVQKICELATQAVTQTGFRILEVNLSCPNEKHCPIYKDIPNAIKLLKFINNILKNHKHIKLVAKIGVLTQDEAHAFLSEAGEYINAVSAINTVSADIYTAEGQIALGSKSASGGICGSLILEQGLRMAATLVDTREKLGIKKQNLSLIGVGGVMNVDNFTSYLNTGVDLVHSATGMMWNLNLAQDVANKLGVSYTVLED